MFYLLHGPRGYSEAYSTYCDLYILWDKYRYSRQIWEFLWWNFIQSFYVYKLNKTSFTMIALFFSCEIFVILKNLENKMTYRNVCYRKENLALRNYWDCVENTNPRFKWVKYLINHRNQVTFLEGFQHFQKICFNFKILSI